jgi:hypothetical protein
MSLSHWPGLFLSTNTWNPSHSGAWIGILYCTVWIPPACICYVSHRTQDQVVNREEVRRLYQIWYARTPKMYIISCDQKSLLLHVINYYFHFLRRWSERIWCPDKIGAALSRVLKLTRTLNIISHSSSHTRPSFKLYRGFSLIGTWPFIISYSGHQPPIFFLNPLDR